MQSAFNMPTGLMSALAQTSFGQEAIRQRQAHEEYRAWMAAVGISPDEVTDHDRAVRAFAESTIHPNGAVIAAGRALARRAAAAHGRIIPENPARWAAQLVRPFYEVHYFAGPPAFDFANYVADLLPLIETAQQIWEPLIEQYGPIPARPSVDDLLALADRLSEPSQPRRSFKDGLRLKRWER